MASTAKAQLLPDPASARGFGRRTAAVAVLALSAGALLALAVDVVISVLSLPFGERVSLFAGGLGAIFVLALLDERYQGVGFRPTPADPKRGTPRPNKSRRHPSATIDLTILMPMFNEAPTAHEAVRRVLDHDFGGASTELIVIDDASTDGSDELIRNNGFDRKVRMVCHERNAGKGAAVRSGLEHARGRYVAVLDADLEYDPADTARMLEPLLADRADAVFGVRNSGSSARVWYPIGNKGINLSTNILFAGRISDVTCCQKVMPTELLRSLPLREPGFGFETELTAHLLRRDVRIAEMPVSYHARTHNEGKKLTALDGLTVMRTLIRCRFRGAAPQSGGPLNAEEFEQPVAGTDAPVAEQA